MYQFLFLLSLDKERGERAPTPSQFQKKNHGQIQSPPPLPGIRGMWQKERHTVVIGLGGKQIIFISRTKIITYISSSHPLALSLSLQHHYLTATTTMTMTTTTIMLMRMQHTTAPKQIRYGASKLQHWPGIECCVQNQHFVMAATVEGK
jgi:hypothetical protein